MKAIILELPGREIEIFVESIPRKGEVVVFEKESYPVGDVIHDISLSNRKDQPIASVKIYLGPPIK